MITKATTTVQSVTVNSSRYGLVVVESNDASIVCRPQESTTVLELYVWDAAELAAALGLNLDEARTIAKQLGYDD